MQESDESKDSIHLGTLEVNTDEQQYKDSALTRNSTNSLLKKIIPSKNFVQSSYDIQNFELKTNQMQANNRIQNLNIDEDIQQQSREQMERDRSRSQKKKVTIKIYENANYDFEQDKNNNNPKNTPKVQTNLDRIKNFIKQTNFDQYEMKRKRQLVSNENIKSVIDELIKENQQKEKQLARVQAALIHITSIQNDNFNESLQFDTRQTNLSIFKFKKNKHQISEKKEQNHFKLDLKDNEKQQYNFDDDFVLERELKNKIQQTNLYRKKREKQQTSENCQYQKANTSLYNTTNQLISYTKRSKKLQLTKQQLQEDIQAHIEMIKNQMESMKEQQQYQYYEEQTLKMMEQRTMKQNMDFRKKLNELETINVSIQKTNDSLESELNTVRLQKKLIRFKKDQVNEDMNEKDNKYSKTLNQQGIVQIEVESELVTLIKEYEEFSKKEKEINFALMLQQTEIETLNKEHQQKLNDKYQYEKQKMLLKDLDYFISVKQYSDKMEEKKLNFQKSIDQQESEEDVEIDTKIQYNNKSILKELNKSTNSNKQIKNKKFKQLQNNQYTSNQENYENEEQEKIKDQELSDDQNSYQKKLNSENIILNDSVVNILNLNDIKNTNENQNTNNYLNRIHTGEDSKFIENNINLDLKENEDDDDLKYKNQEYHSDVANSQSEDEIKKFLNKSGNTKNSEISDKYDESFLDESKHDTSIQLVSENKSKTKTLELGQDWKGSSISSIDNELNQELNNSKLKSNKEIYENLSDFKLDPIDNINEENINSKTQTQIQIQLNQIQKFSLRSDSSKDNSKNMVPKYNYQYDDCNNLIVKEEQNELKIQNQSKLEEKNITKNIRFAEDLITENKKENEKNTKVKKNNIKKQNAKNKKQKRKESSQSLKINSSTIKINTFKNSPKNILRRHSLSSTSNEASRYGSSCLVRQSSFDQGKPRKEKNQIQRQKSKKFIDTSKDKINEMKTRESSHNLQLRIKQFMDNIQGNIDNCFTELIERYKSLKENIENLQIQQSGLQQYHKDLNDKYQELIEIIVNEPIVPQKNLNMLESFFFEKSNEGVQLKNQNSFLRNKSKTFYTMRESNDHVNEQLNKSDSNNKEVQEIQEYKDKMNERNKFLVAEIYNIEKTSILLKLEKISRILTFVQSDFKSVQFRISRTLSNLADRLENQFLTSLLNRTNNLVFKLNQRANSLLQRNIEDIQNEFSKFEFCSIIKLDHNLKTAIINIFGQQGHIYDCISSLFNFFFPNAKNATSQFILQFKKGYHLLRYCKKVDILLYIYNIIQSVRAKSTLFMPPITSLKLIKNKEESNMSNKSLEGISELQIGGKQKIGSLIGQKLSKIGLLTNIFPNEDISLQNHLTQLKLNKQFEEFSEDEQKSIDENILQEIYNCFPNLLDSAAQNYVQIAQERVNQLVNMVSILLKLTKETSQNLQNKITNQSRKSSLSELSDKENINTQKKLDIENNTDQNNQKNDDQTPKKNKIDATIHKKQYTQISKRGSHLDQKDFERLSKLDFNYGQDLQTRINMLQLHAYSEMQIKKMNSYKGINKYEDKESLITIDDIHHIIKKNPQNVNIQELVKEQIYHLHYINNPQNINLGEEFQNFMNIRKNVKKRLKDQEKDIIIQDDKQRPTRTSIKYFEDLKLDINNKVDEQEKNNEQLNSQDESQRIPRSRIQSLWQKCVSPLKVINILSNLTNKSGDGEQKSIKRQLSMKLRPQTSRTNIDEDNTAKFKFPKKLQKKQKSTHRTEETLESEKIMRMKEINQERMEQKKLQKLQEQEEKKEFIQDIKKIVHYKNDFKKAKQNAIMKYQQEFGESKNESLSPNIKLNQQQQQIISNKQQQNLLMNNQQQQNNQNNLNNQNNQSGSNNQNTINTYNDSNINEQIQSSPYNKSINQSQHNLYTSQKIQLEKIKIKKAFASYFKRKLYEKERELEEEVTNLYKHSDNYYQQINQDIVNLSMDDTFYSYLNMEKNQNNNKSHEILPSIGTNKQIQERRDAAQVNSIWHIINRLQAQRNNIPIKKQQETPVDLQKLKVVSSQKMNRSKKSVSPSRLDIRNENIKSQVKIVKHKRLSIKNKAPSQSKQDLYSSLNHIQSTSATTIAPRSVSPITTAKYSPITQSKFKVLEQVLPKINTEMQIQQSPIEKRRKSNHQSKIQKIKQQ